MLTEGISYGTIENVKQVCGYFYAGMGLKKTHDDRRSFHDGSERGLFCAYLRVGLRTSEIDAAMQALAGELALTPAARSGAAEGASLGSRVGISCLYPTGRIIGKAQRTGTN